MASFCLMKFLKKKTSEGTLGRISGGVSERNGRILEKSLVEFLKKSLIEILKDRLVKYLKYSMQLEGNSWWDP